MTGYKLVLIKPFQEYKQYAVQTELAHIMGKKSAIGCLTLPLIAALTPDHYSIEIIDEEVALFSESFEADIVGITITTPTSIRAFEISKICMDKGIPVIMGGPYATFNYDEVIQHSSAVVCGEAEGVWRQCLSDFEQGKLQQKYQAVTRPEYKTSPLPRWDLMDTKNILSLAVQATRGCPFTCEFCLTSKMFGRKMRFREVDNVIEEIKVLPVKNFMFTDDNLTINKQYAKRLFTAMKGLNVTWICQASIDVADDEELLQLMNEAGCRYILIGFESLNPESINETNKHQNKSVNYIDSITRIHNAGMFVYGSFIVGFDHDQLDEFENIEQLINDANMPVAILNILGATSGSDLHKRLLKEGRWYGASTKFNGGFFPLMHYNNFSQTELFLSFLDSLERIFSWEASYKRTINLFSNGKFNRARMDAGVSVFFKIKASLILANRFMLSENKYKRRLFKELFSLARQKKVAHSEAIATMLMLEGVKFNIDQFIGNKDFFLKIIKENDRGSWKSMQAS